MSIKSLVESRNISRVLHFTTNRGCLGVLASGSLKSRSRLSDDEQLKFIFQPNASSRSKDALWLDYVNLSVQEINATFFDICAQKWHQDKDFWWCVLEFSPEVLEHEGVHFSTTNNIYTSVKRAQGEAGLDALFGTRIERWSENVVVRSAHIAENRTTCNQAEILYPGVLSTDHLVAIYVRTDSDSDEVAAQMEATGHRHIDIVVDERIFRGGL